MSVKIKRIYSAVEENDGIRILVDRIWPRGISKEQAKLDDWMKEIAPSTELRKFFNHEQDKFAEFKEKYKEELQSNEKRQELEELINIVKEKPTVTLLFAAKDEVHNQAVVLKEIIEDEVK
ncbi:DUF488 domain-containing protein [Oceanobacillus bengalensis]|uniref:DUF488 domain-containing protein n=1 Tax=Oceanobacillus bengalensis TaxID=1435466 RepID=A0A494Z0E1_9BACI|nr:DUF488 domain-containing protein [Oceanobacillus bengalensis]RKQ15907.1 DUF488 domain-containing protein [Oceanobacillus bengalensis]